MKPSLNDFGVEGHRVPQYDRDKCRGCKVCQIEKHCPVKAAKLVGDKMEIDEKVCKTCGVCTGKCPFKAIAENGPVEYQIFVGGTWGKHTRMGTPLSRLVTQKERLGAAIDRIGADKMEAALFSDGLLERKEEILAAEVKTRP